jgi:tRNA 2-thiouridine synthesizing protein D
LRIDLLIQGDPLASGAPCRALGFARAAFDTGHRIGRVFFYKDAVAIGNRFASDDLGVRDGWTQLAASNGFELAICIAAAARRGIVAESLADGFAIVGLGQLVEAMEESERLVSF